MLSISRGRPDLFRESYLSALNNATFPNNIFIPLRIDSDDTEENIDIYKNILRPQDKLIIGDPCNQSTAKLYQQLYNQFIGYDVYFCLSDDTICRTKNWDCMILSHFNRFPGGEISLARINDGHDRAVLFFWTAKWIEALGFIFPQDLTGGEDSYLDALATYFRNMGYRKHYKYLKNIMWMF